MNNLKEKTGHRLIQAGILLFLLGLLVGFATPALANPRMALSSHVGGVMNGLFLMILGLIWTRLLLSPFLLSLTFWLVVYGTFANWLATFLAALWGAGRQMLPIAGGSFEGTGFQEGLIAFLLISLSLSMLLVCLLLL